ncbi:MAG TPA: nucleotide disphospho-sugar-binding domain-containing protein [Thermoanaerobaculia bacterium]|jgi:MGT family glycosyltransferase|nr:nucleotide disphospho-sugar-binding domain-containing protein [Thermoanaerobaculia bacterium]
MARYLFAPMPITGHVNPGLPIARELVARGHDVRWYSTARFRRSIEAAGARWIPFREAMPVDEERLDAFFPDRPKGGLRQLRYDVKKIFVAAMPGMLRDLTAELQREPADVVVGDSASAAAEAVHTRFGIPWAVYGITVLSIPSRDTAPFGLALAPSATLLGRLRNKALYWLVDRVIFRDANALSDTLRRGVGLPPLGSSIFDLARKADLYLQPSVPSFEYPRMDMPDNLHFIGASVPTPPADWAPPAWWGELEGRRVVLLTQGTINNDYDQLIRPAIRALAGEDVFVVVTTGSRPASDVGISPLPWNVRVEQFIPYAHLMPKVDLLLTNGGYGSVQIALAHGVPVVAIGRTEEKPEIASRVQWSGVGVGLKVRIPSESRIRKVVSHVLHTPTYAARAEALRYELSGLDPARVGADLLEELIGANVYNERCA